MSLTRPAPSLSHPLAIAGVYTLISLLLTWPLILHFGDALPAGGDAWQNVWNLWWLRKAIETGQWPFHTGYKYYPYGVNLYFDTVVPLAGLLGTPLQWLGLNLLSTYNVMVLLSFVLSALGMYLLARYLTGDAFASFIAGFIFGFCPYHVAHLYGHLNLMWTQWLPFYILFLLKTVDGALAHGVSPSPATGEGWGGEQRAAQGGPPPAPTPGQGEPLFAPTKQGRINPAPTEDDATGQQGGINPAPTEDDAARQQGGINPAPTPDQGEPQFAPPNIRSPEGGGRVGEQHKPPDHTAQQSTIYNLQSTIRNALLAGFFLMLTAYSEWTYVAFLALFTIFYLLYRLWGLRRGSWRRATRLVGPLTAMVALFLLLTAPVLLGMVNELHTVQYEPLALTEQLYYSADLFAYLTPSTLHPIFGPAVVSLGQRFDDPPGDLVVTPGITVLLLGILALIVWKRRAVRFWGWAALLFLILSLGPILHIASNTQFTDFSGSMVMPYALLYNLPFFSVMRTPLRFAVIVTLALAVLAAYALKYIRARQWGGYVTTWVIPFVLLGLIAFEYIALPVPMVPPSQPLTFYHQIHDEAGNFAVAELPLRPMVDYLAYQTVSEKPIVGGHLARQPLDKFAAEQPALRYFADDAPAAQDSEVRNGAGAAALAKAGVRYVAVHWWALTTAQKATMQRKLNAVFGNQQPTEYPADQMSVYKTGG